MIPPKFQTKIPSQYWVFLHGARQKYTLPLKTNFDIVIFCPFWHFITKCAIYFITKCDKSLLQNASTFLLQNVTVYYKMRQFVQDETFITKCVGIHHLQDLIQGLRNCFNNRLLTFIKCFAEHQTSRYLPVQS